MIRTIQVGHIIICNKIPHKGNATYNLILGHKYIIRKIKEPRWQSSEDDLTLEIEHLVTGKNMGLYSMNFFIPLSKYREEQINKILG